MKNLMKNNVKYNEIRAIENKYGLMLFRCGLSHLVSCGAQLLQDEKEVEACKNKIKSETPDNAIMTAGFQCEIINCAVELSKINIWDLFRYIKTDVEIDEWCEG